MLLGIYGSQLSSSVFLFSFPSESCRLSLSIRCCLIFSFFITAMSCLLGNEFPMCTLVCIYCFVGCPSYLRITFVAVLPLPLMTASARSYLHWTLFTASSFNFNFSNCSFHFILQFFIQGKLQILIYLIFKLPCLQKKNIN